MSKEFRQARMISAGERNALRKLAEVDRFLCRRMHAACNSGKLHIAEFYFALLGRKYDECKEGIAGARKARREKNEGAEDL